MSDPKATIQILLDEGFTADGFGSPADFSVATTGYLARVLAQASDWSAQCVGQDAYDAATAGYVFNQLQRAETRYASAILWQRRIKFMDGAATAGLQADQYRIIQYLQGQVKAALQDALDAMAEAMRTLGLDVGNATPGSYVSLGTVETGRFPSQQNPVGTISWPFWAGEVLPW